MTRLVVHACVLALCCSAGAAVAATIEPPPATPAGTTVDVIQGTKVSDPYRWLEDSTDPKVKAWSDAQNARTRAYLDALPDAQSIKSRLTALITATSPSYFELAARGNVVFAMYSDPAKQQPMLVTLDAKADPRSRRAVLDPNQLDAKGLTSIDWFVPSPDGKLVAVSLSKNGSEDGTLHVFDVASGKEIDAPIPRVQYPTAGGSLAWTADGKWLLVHALSGRRCAGSGPAFQHAGLFPSPGQRLEGRRAGAGARTMVSSACRKCSSTIAIDRPSILASVQRGDGGEWAFYVLARRTARGGRSQTIRTASSTPRSDPTMRSMRSAAPVRRTARSSS